MTADKELLELAAKAAGIRLVGPTDKYIAQHNKGSAAFIIDNDQGGNSNWNPLTDDGDALRLAVKLELTVEHITNIKGVRIVWIELGFLIERGLIGSGFDVVNENANTDPYAATRRAIVRAAAAIGAEK